MLDNLRESASQSPFFQEEQTPPPGDKGPRRKPLYTGKFLGLTPAQRFVFALMFFMMVCVFGAFVLVFTEKIWL